MPDPMPSVERRWGADSPQPPGRARRRALLAVLLALIAVTGVTVGVLYWLAPPQAPAVLPVWATTAADSAAVVPWAAQDRAALVEGDLLGRPLDGSSSLSRDQLRLRFRALAAAPRTVPLVVMLAVPAAVDSTGSVYLLPADPPGDNPRNRLPLAELLGHVRDCPARDKLLVLQLTAATDDPVYAPPPGELSAAVFRTLDATPDANRLCLVACGPGQVPLTSPDLGRSVFGHYLETGLRGAADGWGPNGDRDGRVTVTELAAFVRNRVSRWAAANLRADQTPVLVGTASDFTVRSYPLSRAGTVAPGEAPASPPAAYPDWLKAGWEKCDRWAIEKHQTAPRAVRLLQAALLTAERDLLAGRSAEDVQRALEARFTALDALAASLEAVPAPEPLPTLAAAFPGYVLPDPTLGDALDRAQLQADLAKPPPPPKPGQPPATPAPTEFDKLAKEKPHRELTLAAFRQLAFDPNPSAARVRRVAQLLAAQEPTPKYAETVLIQRLGELAEPTSLVSWSAERAALALQIARQLEDVAARPDVIARSRPALDEAYRLRADAEAVLFAPGFANPTEATRRLHRAADAAAALKAAADQLRSARATRDEAAAWLAGIAPAVDAKLLAIADVTRLADALTALTDTLAEPEKLADTPTLAELARSWRDREAAVRAALAPIAAPFRPAALARLRTAAEAGDASPLVRLELDAVLQTQFLSATDRANLWTARASLTHRLNEAAVRKDAADDEAIRRALTPPDAVAPTEPAPSAALDPAWTARHAAFTAALVRVSGLSAEAAAIEAELNRLAADLPAFVARLRQVWLEDMPARLNRSPAPAAARLARIAPIVPGTAFLDSPDRNPTAQLRREQSRRMWRWQAARFTYESRDRADAADRLFATLAARACAAVAGSPEVPELEVTTGPEPVLTAEKDTAELRVNLRLVGPSEPQPVTVRLLTPSDEWVSAADAAPTDLGPIREQATVFPIAAGPRPSAHPELRGVLVEATEGGRTYHRRVPVSLDALVNRLNLLARFTPADPPRPLEAISLRPHGIPQPFQLVLGNPTPKPRTVVARLVGFDRVTAPVTVEPGRFAALVFPTASAASAAPSPSPMAQPVSAEPPFTPLAGPLVVELIDPADAAKVLQRFTVPVRVLDPAQYLKVDEVTFRPPAGARPNRLSVRVVPESPPPGPPVQVKVQLPADRNPDVAQVRDANLSGPLPSDNRPLTLYAEDVAFTSAAGARVVVTVGADGVDRAFTFAGTAPGTGAAVRLAALPQPMVRVSRPQGAWFAQPATPLAVPLEVDNAPEGARVELRLGTEKTDPATGEKAFVTDAALTVEPARERERGIRFDPKGESFFLRGSLKDPHPLLPVGLLVGARTLEARLLDAGGTVLDTSRAVVIFDGTPPVNVQFLDLPPRVGRGQPLPVRATCDPTVSGIKEVWFFVGKPAEGKLPASPPAVPGKLIDPKANVWAATVHPGTGNRATLGVQFVTRAGLSKIETADVELADPAELAKPKPGRIIGKVTEAGIAQGGQDVFLYNEKKVAIAKTTTKKDGSYEFADVPPGRYSVYAFHEITNRDGLAEVTVAAGTATPADLMLYLRSTPQ